MSSVIGTYVYALHGFLGRATDWDRVRSELTSDIHLQAEDMFQTSSADIKSFDLYVDELRKKVQHQAKHRRRIFLGYSLGGRLGLHLLRLQPDLFDHYILLSTNPGLAQDQIEEKKNRISHDKLWASRINREGWSEFLQQWNAQSVLQSSLQEEPQRSAEDFDLAKLQSSLEQWSLGHQDDFKDIIRKYQDRISWVVGSKDTKYVQIAEELKQQKCLQEVNVVNSGHRIWADAPQAVAALIRQLRK